MCTQWWQVSMDQSEGVTGVEMCRKNHQVVYEAKRCPKERAPENVGLWEWKEGWASVRIRRLLCTILWDQIRLQTRQTTS
jgi:hypothetical protein